MTKTILSLTGAAFLLLGGIVFYVGSGGYDMGADTPHWEMTRKAIEVVRDSSISLRAKNIEAPIFRMTNSF
jgi:hypothetical protein